MKNFLLILITCITILFTSCNTNYFDDYEKEETTTIMTRVVQDPLHPISMRTMVLQSEAGHTARR